MAKKKILVVDDMKVIRDILWLNLKKVGYEPILASNGKEALRMVESEKPDLVIPEKKNPCKGPAQPSQGQL